MLNRYFIRPTTVDRIRASWIGDAIERYVVWLSEQNYAARNVFVRVPILLRFGEFAQGAGANSWEELPAHVESFVETWLKRQGREYSELQRQAAARGIRNPIQQLLRLILPHTGGQVRIAGSIRGSRFLASSIFCGGNAVFERPPWFSTGIIFSGFRTTCTESGGHCYPIYR